MTPSFAELWEIWEVAYWRALAIEDPIYRGKLQEAFTRQSITEYNRAAAEAGEQFRFAPMSKTMPARS